MTRNNRKDDPYARGSFGMRGMTRWQLWSITIVSVAIIIAAVFYTIG